MHFAKLDAISVDAFGTLLTLSDPTDALGRALGEHGIQKPPEAVARAFRAEVAYYRPRSHLGRDATSLRSLRRACVRVFLDELGVAIWPDEFIEPFMSAVVFDLIPGARQALDALGDAGLTLACVANWDVSLHELLAKLAVADRFAAIVTSADVGAEKPSPLIFARALAELGVDASHALHIGDEDIDRLGAQAAGLRFAPTPLATLPDRLGLTQEQPS